MEYWDIYDKNKNKTGKIIQRGQRLLDDEYHLIVHIWIKNSEGKFLIQQRSEKVKNPLVWSATGGSVVAGEDIWSNVPRPLREGISSIGGGAVVLGAGAALGAAVGCGAWVVVAGAALGAEAGAGVAMRAGAALGDGAAIGVGASMRRHSLTRAISTVRRLFLAVRYWISHVLITSSARNNHLALQRAA